VSEGLLICCTLPVVPPPAFRKIWIEINSATLMEPERHISAELLGELRVMLIFSDLMDPEQEQLLLNFSILIDEVGADAPPMILVPHSTSSKASRNYQQMAEVMTRSLDNCIDDVIPGEPVGMKFVFAVRSRFGFQVKLVNSLSDTVNQRREVVQRMKDLLACKKEAVWNYLRVRLHTGLPPIDDSLPPGLPTNWEQFKVGRLLGEGNFGKVYKLDLPDGSDSAQVIKITPKEDMTNIYDLRSLKVQVAVMVTLSSPEWSHPHIVKLHEIYHSQTHLIFRMEDGGPENLFKRLQARERRGRDLRPLPAIKVRHIISQLNDAFTHMHLGPQIAHRDIKPENIIFTETPEQATIKLSDFDTAKLVQESHVRCRGLCGTYPFAAPEIVLDDNYDPLAADVWSTAVVTLEVLCRVHFIENILRSVAGNHMEGSLEEQLNDIRSFFARVDIVPRLLRRHVLTELRGEVAQYQEMLEGMLNTLPHQRWTAARIVEATEVFQTEGQDVPT